MSWISTVASLCTCDVVVVVVVVVDIELVFGKDGGRLLCGRSCEVALSESGQSLHTSVIRTCLRVVIFVETQKNDSLY